MGELKNQLIWSTSRGRTFDECKRQYYFNYYASWGGWKKSADPRCREAYALKQLSSRHLWAGNIVHEEISSLLRRLRDTGQKPDQEAIEDKAVQRMRSMFRISRDLTPPSYRSDPKGSFRLMEHEYAQFVSKERWVEIREKVTTSLRNFFLSDTWKTLRSLPRAGWLLVEDPSAGPDKTKLGELEVYAQPDCAYRDDKGAIHVIDWKTGKTTGAYWDQLALYALYAEEKWGEPAERVRAREVNLFLGREQEYEIRADDLDHLRETVLASLDAMTAMLVDQDAERNEPLPEESFPFIEDRGRCRWCFYQKICPAVQEEGTP